MKAWVNRQVLRRRDGWAVVLMIVMMPMLLAFLGLVLDMGWLMLRSQMLDQATDAAALAATDAWDREYWKWHGKVRIDEGKAEALARSTLRQNMSEALLTDIDVAPANRVTVRTSTTVPFFFLKIVGVKETTVDSFSTAVRQDAAP